MIWIWLFAGLRWVGRMLFLPPNPPIPVIDPCAPCPACGHRNGKIMCVPSMIQMQAQLKHTCKVCGAHWFQVTVLKETTGYVYPSELA